jgi:RNA polymerase sigma factor (sigma-70 family)
LYGIIQQALIFAKDAESPQSAPSLEFLVKVYEPFIVKVSKSLYQKMSLKEEFNDILQLTYEVFLKLVYNYNPDIASFSYYIKKMLLQHTREYIKKYTISYSVPICSIVIENCMFDPYLSDEDKVYDIFNSYILEKEYIEFIKEKATQISRRKTIHEVCYRHFLNKESCSEIAAGLNITYHAVYQVIEKIKADLIQFFNRSKFCDYIISSTGIEFIKNS